MSLWHCVELCKLSLPLILKCLGMLPLITYKHSNSLPAPCPCFHKPWLAYHLSNSETLLEMTLLTKVIARQTTRGLACLAAHLEVTLTHDWDWGIYGRLSWRITEVPLLVYNHGSGWTTWLLAVGKKLETTLLTNSRGQRVNWKFLSSVVYPVASVLIRSWERSALLVHDSTRYCSFYRGERKTLAQSTSSPSPISKNPHLE